jgi:hypothetical protein
MPEENEKLEQEVAAGSSTEKPPEAEKGCGGRLRLREIFQQAFEKARREQQPVTSKRELGRPEPLAISPVGGGGSGAPALPRRVFVTKQGEEARRNEAPGNAGSGTKGGAWAAGCGTSGLGNAAAERGH